MFHMHKLNVSESLRARQALTRAAQIRAGRAQAAVGMQCSATGTRSHAHSLSEAVRITGQVRLRLNVFDAALPAVERSATDADLKKAVSETRRCTWRKRVQERGVVTGKKTAWVEGIL